MTHLRDLPFILANKLVRGHKFVATAIGHTVKYIVQPLKQVSYFSPSGIDI